MNLEIFNKLLETGVKHGASDVHFRPGAPPMYRVQKQLVPLKSESMLPAHTEAIARLLLAPAGRDKTMEDSHEHDTSYSLPGTARFRVNIYKQRGSWALVLRIIPTKIPSLDQLGLPKVVRRIAENERGLVLVTGATGSGKSTTLASMLDHINDTRMGHIVTIEDPIEFLHANKRCSLSQREIGLDTRSFVSGLRAALRQDPDYVLVGEMRDAESIDIALKAAETGHMVFSTVHTTDAEKTIGRVIGVFPAEEQKAVRLRLADNLKATISQRLLPRADGKGLCVAAEVMIVTGTVREAISDPGQGSIKDIIESSSTQYHMQTFDQHLVALLRAGIVSKEVALQACTNPADFERTLSFT